MTDESTSLIRHAGDCQWCEADFGCFGRLLGSLLATLHAYRHHWSQLEEVAAGTDPEEVES